MFTDSPQPMLAAEATHRDHAIIEQVIADLKDSALAHLPSGHFNANAAWLVCAAIAHNLTRAAGALASRFHARARTSTIRSHLISIPPGIPAPIEDQLSELTMGGGGSRLSLRPGELDPAGMLCRVLMLLVAIVPMAALALLRWLAQPAQAAVAAWLSIRDLRLQR